MTRAIPKRTMDQLARHYRKLYRGTMLAWEQEKVALAGELHDGACQDLARVKINLERLGSQIANTRHLWASKDGGDAYQDLLFCINDLRDSIRKLRYIMDDLHRPQQFEDDFFNALSKYLEGISSRHAVKVEFNAAKSIPAFRKDDVVIIFRIIQEAVVNAIKHSGARHVWVDISRLGDQVLVAIRDNGKGFSVSKAQKQSGYGMRFMQERCDFIGGKFAIESRSGKGTKILVSIPVKAIRPERL